MQSTYITCLPVLICFVKCPGLTLKFWISFSSGHCPFHLLLQLVSPLIAELNPSVTLPTPPLLHVLTGRELRFPLHRSLFSLTIQLSLHFEQRYGLLRMSETNTEKFPKEETKKYKRNDIFWHPGLEKKPNNIRNDIKWTTGTKYRLRKNQGYGYPSPNLAGKTDGQWGTCST